MPRHLLRRAPQGDPSTPPTAVNNNNNNNNTLPIDQQPPRLQARAPAPAVQPAFQTPPGFQLPASPNAAAAIHARHAAQPLVTGAVPWPYQTPEMAAAAAAVGAGILPGGMQAHEDQQFEHEVEVDDEHEHEPIDEMEGEGEEEHDEDEEDAEEEDEDEDEEMHDRNKSPSPLPPNLREISSLASWTVSTHKPGCGVAALRHPSSNQFWQSDGPQPHTLTLHFFKLVAIVKIRVYLDFELDESYTPTKMVFLAGMGGNDLVEFASWEGEGPCGWVDIPLEGVGGRSSNKSFSAGRRRRRRRTKTKKSMARRQTGGPSSKRKSVVMVDAAPLTEESDNEEWNVNGHGDDQQDNIIIPDDDHDYSEDVDDDDNEDDDLDDPSDPYTGNVLKAMVIQMRICENHQNGKDTHVRGFQVFAQDDDRRRVVAAAAAAAHRRQSSVRKSLRAKDSQDEHTDHVDVAATIDEKGFVGLEEPDWMGEPVIR